MITRHHRVHNRTVRRVEPPSSIDALELKRVPNGSKDGRWKTLIASEMSRVTLTKRGSGVSAEERGEKLETARRREIDFVYGNYGRQSDKIPGSVQRREVEWKSTNLPLGGRKKQEEGKVLRGRKNGQFRGCSEFVVF